MLLSFPSYMENNTLENVSINEEEQIYKGIVVHVLAKRYTVSGQGTIIRTNKKGQPYKGIVIFMIDCVKQPNPYRIQTLPEVPINGELLANKLEDRLT